MDKKVLLLLIAIIILNIFFNSQFQLHYDEAYYWTWGQHLSLSYYDHPPMIAYMMRLTSILGYSEVFVRLSAIITTSVTIITMYKLAQKMFDDKTANVTVILAIACPLIEAMFFVVTIDDPLLMFWALTLYAFYTGVFEHKTKYIYFAGIFAGLGLLSKYTMVLIFPGLFIFLITSKEYRHFLYKKDLYLSFLLAIMVFSPVIIWNYQHQWASFVFQFHHGIGSESVINSQTFGDYWGGAALAAGPIIFIAMLYYFVRYIRANLCTPAKSFLFWSYIFGILFFAYVSLTKHTEANWTAPLYISAIILLANWLVTVNNKWVYRASLGFIFIVLVVTKFPLSFTPAKYHNRIPGLNIFYGNKELLQSVKPYLTPGMVLLACDYGNASRAWYYLHLERTYVLQKLPFANSYRYWGTQLNAPIKNAIYICDSDDQEAQAVLHKYFSNIRLLEYATYSNVMTDNKEYIYQVSN